MFGRLVRSRPSRCAASIASRSAARRSARRSATGRQRRDEAAQRELVAVRAEPAEHRPRPGCESRVAALRLSSVHVRQVDFDERHGHGGEGVAEGEARVAVGAGVDHRAGRAPAQRLHGAHELTLAVVLRALHLGPQLAPDVAQASLDLGERGATVKLRLARSEEIEVGTIQYCDHHFFFNPSSHAWNCSMSRAALSSSSPCAPGAASGVAADGSAADAKNWSNENEARRAASRLRGVSRNTWSSDSSDDAGRVADPGAADALCAVGSYSLASIDAAASSSPGTAGAPNSSSSEPPADEFSGGAEAAVARSAAGSS